MSREQFVLDQLGEAGQRLGALQKRLPAGTKQLQRLHHELDFPDAASPELHVALQFASLDHFVLDAVLHSHDLANTLSLMDRGYRNGWISSRNSAPSVSSPATPRALISIIRSQVWPHCA